MNLTTLALPQAKLIAAGIGLAALAGVGIELHHLGYKAGIVHEQPMIAALQATIDRTRTATVQAQADDLQHARTVEASQDKVSTDVSTDYQRQLAALRARYDSLRAASAAHSSGGSGAGVSTVSGAASGVDGTASENGLPTQDALTASESATRLAALQDWVRGQVGVTR